MRPIRQLATGSGLPGVSKRYADGTTTGSARIISLFGWPCCRVDAAFLSFEASFGSTRKRVAVVG